MTLTQSQRYERDHLDAINRGRVARGEEPLPYDARIHGAHVAAPGAEALPYRALSLAALLEDPQLLEPPQASVPFVLWEGRSTMIAGREKYSGKSTFMRAAAAAKSRGGRFLGEACEPGTVLLVFLEEHRGDIVQGLVRFRANPARVHLLDRLEGATLQERIGEIRREAEHVSADVVLLDSFQRLTEGIVKDARSSAEMHPPAQALTTLAHDTGMGVGFSHHAKKDGTGYRDSTALGAAVDMIAEITTPDEKADETRRLVTLRGRVPARDFEYRFDGDAISLVHGGDEPVELRILDAITASPGITHRALRTLIGGRARTVDAAIEQLLNHYRIVDHGDHRGRKYHIVEAAKSLRDKAGHASSLGENGSKGNGIHLPNLLRDKAGHAPDTPRDTPNDSGCVPLFPYREHSGDTHTPEAAEPDETALARLAMREGA